MRHFSVFLGSVKRDWFEARIPGGRCVLTQSNWGFVLRRVYCVNCSWWKTNRLHHQHEKKNLELCRDGLNKILPELFALNIILKWRLNLLHRNFTPHFKRQLFQCNFSVVHTKCSLTYLLTFLEQPLQVLTWDQQAYILWDKKYLSVQLDMLSSSLLFFFDMVLKL